MASPREQRNTLHVDSSAARKDNEPRSEEAL